MKLMNHKIRIPAKAGGPRVATGMRATQELDVRGLERDLANAIEGEVRFDVGSRALYATDASNYRQVPIGVVVPRDADDVVAAMAGGRGHRGPGSPPRG